jgi:hypothetical protein
MLVRVEAEFDDTVLSVTKEDRLVCASSNRSGSSVLCLGRAVGQIIAALGAGSSTPIDVMIEEFHEAVLRSARSAVPYMPHTCDGVACC